MKGRPELSGFARQTRIEHALTFLGGVAVFAIAYLGTLELLLGGIEVAVSNDPEATALRRRAMAIGSVACWTYFTVAFVAARGGPLLNLVIYPGILVSAGPTILHYAVFNSNPRRTFTNSLYVYSPTFTRDALTIIVPGAAACALILAIWAFLWLEPGEGWEWAERNLTEEFKEEFIEKARRQVEQSKRNGGV